MKYLQHIFFVEPLAQSGSVLMAQLLVSLLAQSVSICSTVVSGTGGTARVSINGTYRTASIACISSCGTTFNATGGTALSVSMAQF